MEKFIRVTGQGQASVAPDIIGLQFTLTTTRYQYEELLEDAARLSRELLKVIMANDFEEKDLKTTAYTVDTKYRSYHDKNDQYQREFIGYENKQQCQLEFSLDFTRLANILTAVSQTIVQPDFTIYFTIADKDTVKDLVLIDATQKAQKSAKVLAEASGVKLGNIIRIDYSWKDIYVRSQTDYSLQETSPKMMTAEITPHIVPEDIDITESVEFVWEII